MILRFFDPFSGLVLLVPLTLPPMPIRLAWPGVNWRTPSIDMLFGEQLMGGLFSRSPLIRLILEIPLVVLAVDPELCELALLCVVLPMEETLYDPIELTRLAAPVG